MIMWYNETNKKIKYNNAQLETEILLSWKRVFFIDGPSTCGKTHFVKNLHETNRILYPTHLFVDELIAMFDEKIPEHKRNERIESMFPCRILCFDDADMTLAGKDATQQEIAYIVKRLIEKRKVIFLGINLKKRCGTLLRIIGEDSYEFFLFDKKQNHRKKGHIGESDYESALLLDCCNLKVGNWYHFCPRCGKKIDLETCKTIQVPVPNTIDLFDYITWECSCRKGYERYGYNYCPICGKEREK